MNKFLLTAISLGLSVPVFAQQAAPLTVKDYEHAERFMNYNTEQMIDHGTVMPNWLPGELFWYRILTAQGSEFVLVNPVKGTRTVIADRDKLATAISDATGKKITADAIRVNNSGRSFGNNEVLSPDGKKAAFIQDYYLWVRTVGSNEKKQLTTDGVKDFGYATDNAGWKKSDQPILVWSPDSKKIATFQQDQRKVSDMYLVTTNVGKPTLKAWKYALPGDQDIATIQRVIVEVDNPKVVVLKVPADPHRATLSDDISSGGKGLDDVDWNSDGSSLAFVSTSRDHKQEKFRIADATTGDVREVFEETVATQFESGQGSINWRYLQASKEIIWYSERDNWGHLYLYDAATGKVKNQITKGNWMVTKVLKVDEKKRVIYFLADGRDPENPYFTHLYKVGFDGKNLVALTPEPGNHQITLSPANTYFIDKYSKPDLAPVTNLRNLDGKLITVLEKTDISRLQASGWKAPVPITVKAHDGQTDLYGLMYTPTNLDVNKKYPVINKIYPGPQGGSVGSWAFSASRGDDQSLAELGFIVVEIEGSSNPLRSKSYHDMNYGNIADNTLPDQVTGMQQLAKKYPYIDIDRAGIWGHSGGGFATAAAMFHYPDFFKVGISESGNHDNRNYEDDWGERYIGLLTKQADGTSNYEAQANQNFAKNLKGKLMLAHGLMDDNVPPYNTMLVVEALEKANKDYDLVIFPNSPHGYGSYSPYMTRRRWDYFVRYLLGTEPPHEYQLKAKQDPRNAAQ